MELLVLLLVLALVGYYFQARDERRRVNLLASYLGHYEIEKLMATLTEGYMRALGESSLERQAQIWSMLETAETALSAQFSRFVAELSRLDATQARVSKLPVSIFYTAHLFPKATFDLRKALNTHAQGIANAVANPQQHGPKEKAFTLLAEMFLMQHTCHWFCKSKTIATARMLARHKTPHEQLVDSVSPQTRSAYLALVKGGKDVKGA